MAVPRSLYTPIAIVVAGALVGVGIFAGLSRRPGADGEPSSPSVTPGSATLVTGASSDVVATATSPAAATAEKPASLALSVSRDQLVRDATHALDQRRKAIVDACVAPALANQPQPPNVKLTFQFTFDASGNQLGRGVAEDRATSRPEVTQCVLAKLQPIAIPAPGVPVVVEVPWVLP